MPKIYKTTVGNTYSPEQMMPVGDPIPPEGDGWRLVGGAADTKYLYFFWEKDERSTRRARLESAEVVDLSELTGERLTS